MAKKKTNTVTRVSIVRDAIRELGNNAGTDEVLALVKQKHGIDLKKQQVYTAKHLMAHSGKKPTIKRTRKKQNPATKLTPLESTIFFVAKVGGMVEARRLLDRYEALQNLVHKLNL